MNHKSNFYYKMDRKYGDANTQLVFVDNAETETFEQLVFRKLREAIIRLSASDIGKLINALRIYDLVMEVIKLDDYSSNNDGNIASDIIIGIKHYLKHLYPFHYFTIDRDNAYGSIVTISIINNLKKYAYSREYDHFYNPTLLTTAKSQENFLFYVLIPIYNTWAKVRIPTISEIEAGMAIADPTNPRYNPGLTRYLKEKYGNHYYLSWRELINNETVERTVDQILAELRKVVEIEDAKKYTPGTLAFKKLADSNAIRFGKLSPECNVLDYEELETLCKMYLQREEKNNLCKIVNLFENRIELDQPCDQCDFDDIIDVLDQLVDTLPKFELCQVLNVLHKPVAIPLITTQIDNNGIKIFKNAVTNLDQVRNEIIPPYYNIEEVTALTGSIDEITKKKTKFIRLIPYSPTTNPQTGVVQDLSSNEISDWDILQSSANQLLVILKGTVRIRLIRSDEWISDVLLEEGDVMELIETKVSKVVVESKEILAFYAELHTPIQQHIMQFRRYSH